MAEQCSSLLSFAWVCFKSRGPIQGHSDGSEGKNLGWMGKHSPFRAGVGAVLPAGKCRERKRESTERSLRQSNQLLVYRPDYASIIYNSQQ